MSIYGSVCSLCDLVGNAQFKCTYKQAFKESSGKEATIDWLFAKGDGVNCQEKPWQWTKWDLN